MPAIAYHMAPTTGHGKFKPTVVQATQAKVLVGGIPAVVDGDPIVPHGHPGTVIAMSTKVMIGGKKAAAIADQISCGDMIAAGSPKVFIK